MIKNNKMVGRSLKAAIVIISLAFLLLKRYPVSADIAPPYPPKGSDLHPEYETTNVRMMSEYVLIDIAGYSSYQFGHANVTAQFFMRNLGDVTEQMRVRFPMNLSGYWVDFESLYYDEACEYSPLPSLSDLRVWVDGDEVDVDIRYETILDPYNTPNENNEEVYITVPCWAYFDVTFPPGQDVTIKVAYIVSGYNVYGYHAGGVEFSYVIGTGAGWKGTIGKADIVARLPYEVTNHNLYECYPENCSYSGKEISWQFKDFEPEGNLELIIVRPPIWLRILEETENTTKNPEDGEAWGRLGKAYKDAITLTKGIIYLYEPRWLEMYEISQNAYQKAIELLPDDADWHYGYADLLCNRAEYSDFTFESWQSCLIELKAALDIDPEHEQAVRLLKHLNSTQGGNLIEFELVYLDWDQPVFLLLSRTPSPTHTPTLTPSITGPSTPTTTLTNSSTPTVVNTKEDTTHQQKRQSLQSHRKRWRGLILTQERRSQRTQPRGI